MTERHDVAGLLELLTSEGMLDSTGKFTLDSRLGWEKAKNLRFADPNQYLRCLYRGAVLGEATRIDFYVDSDDTILSFDGPPISRRALSCLLASLYVDNNSYCARKLQQLGMGIQGGLAHGYSWAEVHSEGVAFRYLPNSPEPVPVKPVREGSLVNQIRFKRPFGTEVVRRYLAGQFEEEQAFLEGQGWSSVCTSYNGRKMARNRCRQCQFRIDTGLPPSLHLANWERPSKLELPEADVEFSAIFDVVSEGRVGEFHLVLADVTVPRSYTLPECPGLQATVAVGPMQLDASQVFPVENEEFARLVGYLRLVWALGVMLGGRSAVGHSPYRNLFKPALATWKDGKVAALSGAAAARELIWNKPLLPTPCGGWTSLHRAAQAGRIVFGSPSQPGDLQLRGAALPLLEAAELQAADQPVRVRGFQTPQRPFF